jgi:predicted ribosomally synthesized peptide with nif11-like leader
MSKPALAAFRSKLAKSRSLREEMLRTLSAGGSKRRASFAELTAFAKACGFEITVEETRASLELSDQDLDAVAGGVAVLGGERRQAADSSTFDCSELTQWAVHQTG